MFLIDSLWPSQLSTASVPQTRTDLRDAAHTQPLKRIIQIAADIVDVAEVRDIFETQMGSLMSICVTLGRQSE
jgi:hypothetical protein